MNKQIGMEEELKELKITKRGNEYLVSKRPTYRGNGNGEWTNSTKRRTIRSIDSLLKTDGFCFFVDETAWEDIESYWMERKKKSTTYS